MPFSDTVGIFRPLLVFCILLNACTQSEPPFQCTDSIGCVTVEPGEPLKICVLQALSGEVEPLGQAQLRGLEQAMELRLQRAQKIEAIGLLAGQSNRSSRSNTQHNL